MSLLLQLAIAAVIFVAGAAGGIKWHAGQDAIAENARLEQEAKERGIRLQRIDTAAQGHERDKNGIQAQFREITKEVERVIEKPVYRDVCLDADGLRVLESAIGAAPAASQPARAVPRPEPAR